jgi:hypothetical protein
MQKEMKAEGDQSHEYVIMQTSVWNGRLAGSKAVESRLALFTTCKRAGCKEL